MALKDILTMYTPTAIISWTLLPLVLISWIVIRCIYRIFFHPLRHIPGPLRTKCSSLWFLYHQYIGDQCTAIHTLHNEYGPVVRVGPNDIDIAKNDALGPIYVDHGGFDKSEYYRKYDMLGHPVIFSTLSLAKRSVRAKAVLPVFSAQSVRDDTEIISGYANKMVRRMSVEAQTGRPVNILNLSRAFALDVISACVMQMPYNGLEEKSAVLSASAFLDFITILGSYFWVSHSVFVGIQWLVLFIHSDSKIKSSDKTTFLFIDSLVNQAKAGGSSFPSRLLAKGMPADAVAKECADLLYAGTEATSHVLSSVCWNLVANPEQYAALRDEVEKNTTAGLALQSLPYLNGVVKEAMRVSMANPVRLPRVVPPQGWKYSEYFIPPKANVGVAAFELHFDQNIFPEPKRYLPERWLEPTAEMNTNFIPFGKGARSCLARNLATTEILIATEAIVRADVLQGAMRVKDKIEINEWFNSQVKDRAIDLIWSD